MDFYDDCDDFNPICDLKQYEQIYEYNTTNNLELPQYFYDYSLKNKLRVFGILNNLLNIITNKPEYCDKHKKLKMFISNIMNSELYDVRSVVEPIINNDEMLNNNKNGILTHNLNENHYNENKTLNNNEILHFVTLHFYLNNQLKHILPIKQTKNNIIKLIDMLNSQNDKNIILEQNDGKIMFSNNILVFCEKEIDGMIIVYNRFPKVTLMVLLDDLMNGTNYQNGIGYNKYFDLYVTELNKCYIVDCLNKAIENL